MKYEINHASCNETSLVWNADSSNNRVLITLYSHWVTAKAPIVISTVTRMCTLVCYAFVLLSLYLLEICRIASMAPGQSYDCPGASEAMVKDVDKAIWYQTTGRHNKYTLNIIIPLQTQPPRDNTSVLNNCLVGTETCIEFYIISPLRESANGWNISP